MLTVTQTTSRQHHSDRNYFRLKPQTNRQHRQSSELYLTGPMISHSDLWVNAWEPLEVSFCQVARYQDKTCVPPGETQLTHESIERLRKHLQLGKHKGVEGFFSERYRFGLRYEQVPPLQRKLLTNSLGIVMSLPIYQEVSRLTSQHRWTSAWDKPAAANAARTPFLRHPHFGIARNEAW